MLSIVIPCYNEQETLPLFYEALLHETRQMKDMEFEFLFVDDGSSDQTLQELKALRQKDSRIVLISFSRNFGKEAALWAGLQHARGDHVAVMDADLQDPPGLLAEMHAQLASQPDLDCVATRRVTRKGEPLIRSFCARLFYKMINRISETELVDGARDFRMMTRRMVNAILSVGEYNRFSKGIFEWVGFKTHWLEYENVCRAAGETKWSFAKLFLYSIDGFTAFSTAPLALASIVGFVFCIIAFIMAAAFAVKTLLFGDAVPGFPTLICVILLVGGIQLFCIGILGQYLAKTYLETKKRPIYVIKEKDGL